MSQYPYGTEQNFHSANTATTTAGQGFTAYPGPVAVLSYSGPSGEAYSAASGETNLFYLNFEGICCIRYPSNKQNKLLTFSQI